MACEEQSVVPEVEGPWVPRIEARAEVERVVLKTVEAVWTRVTREAASGWHADEDEVQMQVESGKGNGER